MKLWSESFKDNGPIPAKLAFGKPDEVGHVAFSDNRNPHLAWSDLPEGTRSLAVICHDPDVPSQGDDVNQEGKTVPASLPRVDFYHWVLVDLPADTEPLAEGEFSSEVTSGGKDGPGAARGARQGINNYTDWFKGATDMEGDYFGYDGPCPPWNDSIVHHYHFTLYALDVEKLDVTGSFGGPEALAAMDGHVLGTASVIGTYSLNPEVKA